MKRPLSKIIFLFIPIIILCLANHPYTHRMSLSEKGLKGPVKTVYELIFHWRSNMLIAQEFNQAGKLTEIKYFDYKSIEKVDSVFGWPFKEWIEPVDKLNPDEYELSHLYRYKYNKKGDMEEAYSMSNDSILFNKKHFYYDSNDSLFLVVWLQYDSLGNVSDSIMTRFSYRIEENVHLQIRTDNNDTITKYKKWHFDEKGRLVKSISTREDVSPFWHTFDEYEYDMTIFEYEGEKVKKDSYFIIDSLLETEEVVLDRYFTYNESGKLVKKREVRYSSREKETDEEIQYFYNGENLIRKIKIHKESWNDWKPEKYIYSVDKAGNYSSLLSISSSDTTLYSAHFQYDKYDNWTKIKQYENGKPVQYRDSSIRRIEYYP